MFMLKKQPLVQHLNLDVYRNPALMENTSQLGVSFGIPNDKSIKIFNLMMEWEFKAYDVPNGKKILDCLVFHEHQFNSDVAVTVAEVREMIVSSYNQSNDLLEQELKNLNVTYRSLNLDEDVLGKYIRWLHADIQKHLI